MTGDAQNGVKILRAAGNDIIQVSPGELTAFAEKLRAQAGEIATVAAGLDGLSPSVTSLGAQFMLETGARPVYEKTVEQLTATTAAFQTELGKLSETLTKDADALSWIAGQFTTYEVDSAEDIRKIIDSVEPPSS